MYVTCTGQGIGGIGVGLYVGHWRGILRDLWYAKLYFEFKVGMGFWKIGIGVADG